MPREAIDDDCIDRARLVRSSFLWFLGLPLAIAAGSSACRKGTSETMDDGYVAIDDLWKTAPAVEAGQSQSWRMPVRGTHGAEYVSFLFGFSAAPPSIDSPSTIRHVDAKSGKLIREERYTGPHADLPWHDAPGDTEQRYGRVHAAERGLVPAFFRGEPQVPADLRAAAKEYREDFYAILGPDQLPYYVEIAPEWCAWVGIERAGAGAPSATLK